MSPIMKVISCCPWQAGSSDVELLIKLCIFVTPLAVILKKSYFYVIYQYFSLSVKNYWEIRKIK